MNSDASIPTAPESETKEALTHLLLEQVDRFDLCTSCNSDRFFSHRRDHGRTGRQGVIAYVA